MKTGYLSEFLAFYEITCRQILIPIKIKEKIVVVEGE